MDNEQIDFNSYDWQLQRDDRYTCKHCKKFLTFYNDLYICNHCGLVHKQIALLGDPYIPNGWIRAVRFIKTTYIVEDIPGTETNEKKSLTTEEKINSIFTEKLLNKSLQHELWLAIGKISVAECLKKLKFKYKYVDSKENSWSDLYIYKKVIQGGKNK